MKAQISRNSHRPDQRYSGVYQQQGRMITDADWNELVDVLKTRQEAALARSVGSGVPSSGGAVAVRDTRDEPGVVKTTAELRWGTVVVDGLYAEVFPTAGAGAAFDYAKQRDLPFAPAVPEPNVTFYADVWERLVVSFEDENLRDPALHGADTCVRTQMMAQIKCAANPSHVDDPKLNPARGDALLELQRPENATDPGDPCATQVAIASALGNYLFRLEIHDVKGRADAPDELTLKWSSENAAEAHPVGSEPPEFKHGAWIFEFFSEVTERHLGVHLGAPSVERSVLEATGYPSQTPKDARAIAFPFVRRWDGQCVLRRSAGKWSFVSGKHRGEALPLEPDTMTEEGQLSLRLDALVLRLDGRGKRFVAGDYWLALLREHPEGQQPELLSSEPVGIVHRYLRLLTRTAAGTTYPSDTEAARRLSFPVLTDLIATRVGYDPSVASERWRDINEAATKKMLPPATVQDAIDQLAANLDASDVVYALPNGGAGTLEQLLSSLPKWPDLDEDGLTSVKDMLDALLRHLDASRIPYAAGAADTIKRHLDDLRTDVDARVKLAGGTMTGNLIVNAQVGVNEGAPGGTLHVRGGHPAKTHHALPTAIELDNAGDRTAVLQANGANGAFRLSIQDGHGRANQTWNAYDQGPAYAFDVDGEAATWLRIHGGSFSVRTAPGGAADSAIPWNLGLHQTSAGFVGIGTETPAERLDVAGTVVMTGFRLPTAPQDGFVLTSDAQGVGTWQRSLGSAWRIVGNDLISDVTGNVGIGTATPESKLQVAGGAIQPAAGNSTNAGIMFPRDPGGGSGDAAWIRYYPRTAGGEHTTFEIGTSNDAQDHIALMASGNVGIGTTTPTAKLDVQGSVAVTGNIAVTGTVDGVDVSALQAEVTGRRSRYFFFTHLNVGSVNVGTTFVKLNTGTHSFTKARADTVIEVYVNSLFDAGQFLGSSAIRYEIRIDDASPTISSAAVIAVSNAKQFLSLMAVQRGLAAGTHSVSLWARAFSGSSINVMVDPGGFGGGIIVKETY